MRHIAITSLGLVQSRLLVSHSQTAFARRESGLAAQDYTVTMITDLGIFRSSSRRLRLEIWASLGLPLGKYK